MQSNDTLDKTFCRPLLATDWARFEYYEHRIKQLGHCYPPRPLETTPIHADVFIALADHRPIRNFLHNLRVLNLNILHVTMFPFIRGFIGPNLVSVSVSNSDSFHGHHMVSFISALPHLSPKIQDIECRAFDAVREAWSQVIGKLQYLRVVDIEFVTPLKDISHLPLLKNLAVVKFIPENIPLFTTKTGGFRNLERFSFDADLLQVGHVLDAMRCRLISISITSDVDDDLDHVLSHLVRNNVLLARHHGRWLTTLYMELDIVHVEDLPSPPAQIAQALLPLLSIRCLETVNLTTPLVRYLDDKWLEDAAQAWPRLWDLYLVDGYFESPIGFTLGGLLPLLRYCPRLTYLSLCFQIKPFCRSLLEGIDNNYKVLSSSSRPHISEDSVMGLDLVAEWLQSMFKGLWHQRLDDGVDEE